MSEMPFTTRLNAPGGAPPIWLPGKPLIFTPGLAFSKSLAQGIIILPQSGCFGLGKKAIFRSFAPAGVTLAVMANPATAATVATAVSERTANFVNCCMCCLPVRNIDLVFLPDRKLRQSNNCKKCSLLPSREKQAIFPARSHMRQPLIVGFAFPRDDGGHLGFVGSIGILIERQQLSLFKMGADQQINRPPNRRRQR